MIPILLFVFYLIECDRFLMKTKNGQTFKAIIGKQYSAANGEHKRDREDFGEEYQIIPETDIVNASSHKYLKRANHPETARGLTHKNEEKKIKQEDRKSKLSRNVKRQKGHSEKRKNGTNLKTAKGYVTKQHSDKFWQDIRKASSPINFENKDAHPTTARGYTELHMDI